MKGLRASSVDQEVSIKPRLPVLLTPTFCNWRINKGQDVAAAAHPRISQKLYDKFPCGSKGSRDLKSEGQMDFREEGTVTTKSTLT